MVGGHDKGTVGPKNIKRKIMRCYNKAYMYIDLAT